MSYGFRQSLTQRGFIIRRNGYPDQELFTVTGLDYTGDYNGGKIYPTFVSFLNKEADRVLCTEHYLLAFSVDGKLMKSGDYDYEITIPQEFAELCGIEYVGNVGEQARSSIEVVLEREKRYLRESSKSLFARPATGEELRDRLRRNDYILLRTTDLLKLQLVGVEVDLRN